MDAFSVILLINAVFFIITVAFQNVSISLAVSVSLFFLITYLVHRGKLKLTSVDFRIKERLSSLNNRDYIIAVVCLVLFLALEPSLGFNGAIFTVFFLFSHLNKLDSRASFFMALIFLGLTAFLSALGNQKPAEQTAITAYYFMIVGALWQVYEIRKEEPETDIQNTEADMTAKTPKQSYGQATIYKEDVEKKEQLKKIIVYVIAIIIICIVSYFVDRSYSPIIDEILHPTVKIPVIMNNPKSP
ncbi:hypothetical protein GYA28_01095 [Candidatus Roizmanbacteria bacterium]|jgi:hypothetical protein|nr:hypothetical protein [Candidatus Roizmanbacteria bacterium]